MFNICNLFMYVNQMLVYYKSSNDIHLIIFWNFNFNFNFNFGY